MRRARPVRGEALGNCRTCGAKLHGRYCHDCGHDSLPMARKLKDLGVEVIDSVFSYSSAVPRTAWTLIHEPGAVPDAQRAGDKTRFLPPVRLYLTASLLFFLFLGLSGIQLVQVEFVRTGTPWVRSTSTQWQGGGFRFQFVALERRLEQPPDPAILAAFDAASRQQSGADEFDRAVMGVMRDTAKDPSVLNRSLNNWVSRALWLMMPLYALLLWPLFAKGRLLSEHLIFALFAHSIMFLMLTLGALWNLLGVGYGFILALIGYQIWLTRSLKAYYGSRWSDAVAKGWIHSVTYVVFLWGPLLFTFFLFEVGQHTSAAFWGLE